GIAAGAWAVLGFSGVVAVSSVTLLGRLAAVSRSRAAAVAAYVPVARRAVASPAAPVVEPAETTWTPVPLPKPMYLSRAVMQNVVVEADVAVAELQAAAADAQLALRAAEAALPSIRPVEPAPARTLAKLDIDEVLRRRRAAG